MFIGQSVSLCSEGWCRSGVATVGNVGAGRLGVHGLFLVADAVGWESGWQIGSGRDDRLISFMDDELFIGRGFYVVLSKWMGLFLWG